VGTQIDLLELVIAADGNEPSYLAITSTLDQAGIPYDTLIAAIDKRLDGTAQSLADILYTGQHGHYQGVILTTGSLVYCVSNCESAFTTEEWNALWDYEKQFDVRQATYYTYPGVDFGLDYAGYVDTAVTPITNATLTPRWYGSFRTSTPRTQSPSERMDLSRQTDLRRFHRALLTMPDGNVLAAIHTADGRQNCADHG
jgi:hypothetical protein